MACLRITAHPSQLVLHSVLRQGRTTQTQAICQYIHEHRHQYEHFAAVIHPRSDNERAWRVVFAMLSAHDHFDTAVKAYRLGRAAVDMYLQVMALQHFSLEVQIRGAYVTAGLMRAKRKAQWTLTLLQYANAVPGAFTKEQEETWDQYARRIRSWPGLHMIKSQFAAALCYPLESNNACLDTWMMRLLFGHNQQPTSKQYKRALWYFRALAKRCHTHAFLAQWMAWDCCKGSVESHRQLCWP